MTTLLVTDRRDPQVVIPRPGTWRTRLGVRLHSRRLDRALAAGASPDASAALSLRACTLIGETERRRLARALRRLVKDAERPLPPLSSQAPICWRKVLKSQRTLSRFAERLISDEPVDARGVARVSVLLDGDGPVYGWPAADDLEPALQAATEALEVSA